MVIGHLNFSKGFRGGERQTAILIETLSKKGFKQVLFLRKDNFSPSLEEYIKTRQIKNLEIIPIRKPYIFNLFKFRKCDILHSHEAKANQVAFLIYKLFKIPYIITRRVQFTPSKNFFNLAIYKNAKKIIALSEAIKNDLSMLDRSLDIQIIPSSFFKTRLEKINKIVDKKIIGHIGAIVDSHKGQCTILEAANMLRDYKDIHFLLIGDGKDLELCKQRSKNLQNITFLGYKDNPQKYIPQFEIFVFPSNHEGLGSTLLDVMYYNIPIIASDIGGIIDIIEDGENGFLIPPRQPDILRQKILELLENKDLVEKFTKNGKKKIKKFSAKNMTNKYISYYKEILS